MFWAYLALAAAGCAWGLGFVFGKVALASMPVDAMITYRFIIASAAFLALIPRLRPVPPRLLVSFFFIGVLFVPVQFLVQFNGLAHSSVTHAALIVATLPVLLALAGTVLDRVKPMWPAIAVSAIGAMIVVFRPSGSATIYGDVLIFLSMLAGAAWVLLCERYIRDYGAVTTTTYILWLGTLALLAYEAVAHPLQLVRHYPLEAWLATAGAALIATVAATLLWNAGLKRVHSSDAGLFLNLEPVVGSVCGVLLFGDPVGWPLVVGGTLVVAGAVAVTRRSG
jgi:drug/metabolite transporter (DMT)-like permease